MKPKRFGTFVVVAVFWTAALLIARSTAPQETIPAPPSPPSTGPQPTPGRPVPGVVTPPNQGYVVPPQPAMPGTASGNPIPEDPGERGYWELYDPGRSITVTGKVRRVDWSMPNTYIYLTTTTGQWAIEASYIQFRQSSVNPAIHADQTITVMGYLPKEVRPGELPAKAWGGNFNSYLKNHHLIRAGLINTTFGQTLSMGRPPTEAEIAERLKCSPFGC